MRFCHNIKLHIPPLWNFCLAILIMPPSSETESFNNHLNTAISIIHYDYNNDIIIVIVNIKLSKSIEYK
jgi:hypothetical protein